VHLAPLASGCVALLVVEVAGKLGVLEAYSLLLVESGHDPGAEVCAILDIARSTVRALHVCQLRRHALGQA